MGGKLNIYNLGVRGVVIDKSPIHEEDGELLTGQNGQVDQIGVLGGLRCRDGMSKLNAIALAGAVTGSIGLPLPDTTLLTKHFYMPVDDAGGAASANFRTSSTGSSWATTSSGLVYPQQLITKLPNPQFYGTYHGSLLRWATLNGKLYYPGDDYTAGTTQPTVHVWDGTTDYKIATIPQNPLSAATGSAPTQGILSIVPYDQTRLLISTWDDNTRSRVLILDITSGQIYGLGPQTDISVLIGGVTHAVCPVPIVWLGRVWWLGQNLSGAATVYGLWVRPTDLTWTRDTISLTGDAFTGYVAGCVVYNGELWFGSMADLGHLPVLRKRSSLGVYTTQRTSGGGSLALSYVAPLVVSQDGLTLFVFENLVDTSGAGTNTAGFQRIFKTTDGSTFTLEYDVGLNLNNAYGCTGYPLLDVNGDIYWPVGTLANVFKLLKRTVNGTWSIVDGNVNHLSDGFPGRGVINKIRF